MTTALTRGTNVYTIGYRERGKKKKTCSTEKGKHQENTAARQTVCDMTANDREVTGLLQEITWFYDKVKHSCVHDS